MSDYRRDFESWEQYAKRLAAQSDEPQDETPATTPVQQLPPLTIKPGSQHARDAMRAGRDDEYSDRMRARYGGEW